MDIEFFDIKNVSQRNSLIFHRELLLSLNDSRNERYWNCNKSKSLTCSHGHTLKLIVILKRYPNFWVNNVFFHYTKQLLENLTHRNLTQTAPCSTESLLRLWDLETSEANQNKGNKAVQANMAATQTMGGQRKGTWMTD